MGQILRGTSSAGSTKEHEIGAKEDLGRKVQLGTASAIAPPQIQRFFFDKQRFMAARHEERCYEEHIFIYLIACKGLCVER